ncbi:hypothetical protein M0R45_026099 [Rubus argutus]|uniref:Uncharacterized protein n=1 Tax=Rubus argutus TaxID=59490 RepID=A0AAW1WWM3_RUBAR
MEGVDWRCGHVVPCSSAANPNPKGPCLHEQARITEAVPALQSKASILPGRASLVVAVTLKKPVPLQSRVFIAAEHSVLSTPPLYHRRLHLRLVHPSSPPVLNISAQILLASVPCRLPTGVDQSPSPAPSFTPSPVAVATILTIGSD